MFAMFVGEKECRQIINWRIGKSGKLDNDSCLLMDDIYKFFIRFWVERCFTMMIIFFFGDNLSGRKSFGEMEFFDIKFVLNGSSKGHF